MPIGQLMRGRAVAILVCVLALACTGAEADEDSHEYESGETVQLWMNKVGPYHNPQESYSYFSLPFCQAPPSEDLPEIKYAGLGEVLEGHGFIHSGMRIVFGRNQPNVELCTTVLDEAAAEQLRYAIQHHYWYQMYLDDLPIWGMVGEIVVNNELEEAGRGETPDESIFVYTRKIISVAHDDRHVLEVNLTSEAPVLVKPGATLRFTYSVSWHRSDKSFNRRFERYLDYSFFEHQIHWFSIFNSFMMVIFLVGLVALILVRTLRSDYAKYMRDEEDMDGTERGATDDSGWKQVHGDVFRAPPYLQLYTALYGSGHQLFALFFLLIMLSIASALYVTRGAVMTSFIVCYALTSGWAGYTSGSFYKGFYYPNRSPGWITTMVLTASLVPGVALLILFTLNGISVAYGTHSIPFTAAVSLILLWLLVAAPLTVVGTLVGRHYSRKTPWPCRIQSIPKLIPPRPWYQRRAAIILMAGVLPFGSIFIEMWFIFTSFWNYKFYYVYGFMLLVYGILCIVTMCVTIVAIYFLLNAEDYRWWWVSFLSGGSSSAYVFLYAVYYFFARTHMHGFLQICFYFGYMMLFCMALFVIGGTIGTVASKWFVVRIYRNIKVE